MVREPVVRETDDVRGIPALVADLECGSHRLRCCLILVLLILMPSHMLVTVALLLLFLQVLREKRQYNYAVQARHASFSPSILSVDGVMAREAGFVVCCLATKLSTKWCKSYGEVMG